jgi:benzoyl-CoA reductase/2-hydroxyglutaryl-CoA dehydratase subunit BcrC/BadD/HgdB
MSIWSPEAVRVKAEVLARRHAADGGKVVGYLTPCVPDELIEAADLRPMILRAGPDTSTRLGDHYMESLFDTVTRGVFERLLKGEFDYLSAIILPRANDSAHRLYYYLSELHRTGGAKLPPILLSDIAATPDAASLRYSIDAGNKLWSELRRLGGSDRLRPAIEASNRRTRLLNGFASRRRSQPTTGVHALAVFAAARSAPDLLDDLLANSRRRPTRHRLRKPAGQRRAARTRRASRRPDRRRLSRQWRTLHWR